MTSYRVAAPFVTLKVKDFNGLTVVQGYYLDGLVQDPIQDEQFEKHVRNGWVEKVEGAAAPEAPVEPVKLEKPAGNASQETWARYAVDSGQATAADVADLKQTELRELYG